MENDPRVVAVELLRRLLYRMVEGTDSKDDRLRALSIVVLVDERRRSKSDGSESGPESERQDELAGDSMIVAATDLFRLGLLEASSFESNR